VVVFGDQELNLLDAGMKIPLIHERLKEEKRIAVNIW